MHGRIYHNIQLFILQIFIEQSAPGIDLGSVYTKSNGHSSYLKEFKVEWGLQVTQLTYRKKRDGLQWWPQHVNRI